MATDKVQGVFNPPFTGLRYMSNTTGYVVDMLCEDNVSGLVHEDYVDNGSNTLGSMGYTSGVQVKPFSTTPNSGELASIYWNKTPIFDKEAQKFNYSSVDVLTNQQTISQDGLPSRRLIQIGEKLRGLERKTGSTIEFIKYPKYYTVRNKYCNKVIVNLNIQALGKIDRDPGTSNAPNETYGQLLDSDVTINIDYRPIYSIGSSNRYRTGGKVEVQGSLSSPYAKSFELSLPLDSVKNTESKGTFVGWQIRVYKNKEEPTTPDVRNTVVVDNIVEETDDSFIYPKTFVVKNTFEAEDFSSIPERAYDMNLLKVKIPSNYDPITRTYHGDWDGTFSTEATGPYGNVNGAAVDSSRSKGRYWTDNPAWCFYDLITNKRYGLGKYVDTTTLDKWSLYEIGQYCDELVEDSDQGLEPRFSCNMIIQSRQDAYQVLNDMASIFRGIVYYNGGNLFAVQDSFKNAIFQFNNTSVERGEFKYSSTSAKVRHTVAIVRYNDRNNKFEPAVEYVEDVDAIRKYGIKEKELSAFGCTSKSQAQRLGRWVLATESNETETVSFVCGQEGAILRPGDVFSVSDSNRSMTRRGGRIKELNRIDDNQFRVVLDSKLKGGKFWDGNSFEQKTTLDPSIVYQLTVSTPSFYYDTSQVNLAASSEIPLIRNKQIQTFNISGANIDYDYGSTERSSILVNGNLNETSYSTTGFSGEALWSIATTGVNNDAEIFFEKLPQEQEYRVINISESDKSKYEISAAEYSRVKYQQIDEATKPVNDLTFSIPGTPPSMSLIQMTDVVGASNTKQLSFSWVASTVNAESVSYYQIYIKKGSQSTESDFDSSLRVYSTNTLEASFIPATNGQYYVSIYAYNALGQSNSVGAQGNKQVYDVAPIKDVQISHAGLIDNLLGGATSKVSDPSQGGVDGVDQFEDSTAQFKWKTSLPQVQGANIALNFQYQLNVYDSHSPSTSNKVKSLDSYKPDDAELSLTTFNYTLADNYADHSNSYDNISRKLTLEIFAIDENGVSSADQALGGDLIKVENPEPSKPLTVETDGVAPIQGFIDLDNHIRIFNINRASDVKELVILSGPNPFTYNDYVTSSSTATIDVKRISADVDVVQIKPSWAEQTSGGETVKAYFMMAYIDQFDLDVEKLAIANGDAGVNGNGSFDLTKKLANRISDSVEIEKVTQETIDLLGEGWKAWIQIDVDGKWYGRNVDCVQDITDTVDDYKGYLPFYCTRKAPLMVNDGSSVIVGAIQSPMGVQGGVNYSVGCMYHLPGSSLTDDFPINPTQKTDTVGGPTDQTTNLSTTNEFWRNSGRTIEATKGFRRYRVYLKQRRDNPYWVVGMNANNEKYYSDDNLTNLDSFFNGDASPSYADDFKAGATDALSAADADTNLKDKTQIGSSDGYFNFHPAGFVQGFGGLPRQPEYFDVQMGHMIDKSYLSKAIFFVMGTTEETKNSNDAKTCPTSCIQHDCS